MRTRQITAILAGMALLAAGCGPDPLEIEPEHAPDLSLVAGALGGDIGSGGSPEGLIDDREEFSNGALALKVIVTGAVESVEQGRNVYAHEDYREHPDMEPAHRHVVLEVKVDEALRAGDPGDIHDGRVYVELWQGGAKPDENGETVPVSSLEDWREALPVGTRVMLFLLDAYDGNGDSPTEHEGRGLPDGANLLQPDHYGFVAEYDGRLVADSKGGDLDFETTWGVESITEISARVKEHLAER